MPPTHATAPSDTLSGIALTPTDRADLLHWAAGRSLKVQFATRHPAFAEIAEITGRVRVASPLVSAMEQNVPRLMLLAWRDATSGHALVDTVVGGELARAASMAEALAVVDALPARRAAA